MVDDGIRSSLSEAEAFTPRTGKPDTGREGFSTPKGEGGNGGPKVFDGDGLPDFCPVKPIGILGSKCVFLDASDQLTLADPPKLGEGWITQYFGGDEHYLADYWPGFDRNGKATGSFKPELARRAMQRACTTRGIWDDHDKVRGRGAWRGKDGSLVLHCGDVLIRTTGIDEPGVSDEGVYPAGPRMRRPLSAADRIPKADSAEAAAWKVYSMMQTWNWRRPGLDPRLFFGLMIAGFLSGALNWRPSGWVTGEAGSGKSHLQDLRRDVMGSWSLNASDATSAGIFQKLKFDAIAVSLDEQEAGADNRKLDSMVELAREAASSDLRLRGSAGHEGVSFRARSSFLFSSINSAPLKGQDMSRMAQMELLPFEKGSIAPRWTPDQAARWGKEILRVCLDRWHRFDATFERYARALAHVGHDARGQDTFGTLLACADLALAERGFMAEDGPDDDPEVEEIWTALPPSKLQEYADRVPNWLSCIEHLLSSRPHDWKTGTRASIGAEIARYVGNPRNLSDPTELDISNQLLALAGVTIEHDGMRGWELCVPNQHPQLTKIFEGSDWPGRANAPGGWTKAMRSGHASVVRREPRFYVDGVQRRGVRIALDQVMKFDPNPKADPQEED
jgi:hypothetical protein